MSYKQFVNTNDINVLENVKNNMIDEIEDDSLENECIICFEEFSNTMVSTLKCGHKFHYDCIYEWTMNENTCPLCRTPVEMSFYGYRDKRLCIFSKMRIYYKITIEDQKFIIKDMNNKLTYTYTYKQIKNIRHNFKTLSIACYNNIFNLKLKTNLIEQLFTILKNKCNQCLPNPQPQTRQQTRRQTQTYPQTHLYQQIHSLQTRF